MCDSTLKSSSGLFLDTFRASLMYCISSSLGLLSSSGHDLSIELSGTCWYNSIISQVPLTSTDQKMELMVVKLRFDTHEYYYIPSTLTPHGSDNIYIL